MQEELITMLEQKRFHELSRLLRDQTGPDIAALVDEIPRSICRSSTGFCRRTWRRTRLSPWTRTCRNC